MQFEFRDGKREIPDYLADVLKRYEKRLYLITYDEAMELANRTMASDFINAKHTAILDQHFRRFR